ncbi:MAG: FKBP-type peptidyl-prolyl cis-trans isomerase [gamma proteobacterium symbiont of Taylorina sp.]|nr:FKBP-type peptidyl-prolyl cis-trans isomerase [gamma proteobacterium symbiont of Taylorina sp.]
MAQPETLQQKASYALGIDIANSFKKQGIDLDTENVINGIKDGLNGNKTALTKAEMTQALNDFKKQLIDQQQKIQNKQSAENIKIGEVFLAENKTKDGVVTLKSGLQYKVIKSGNGDSPKLTDKVTTHYRGTLVNGKEFDSSYSRNKPTSFPVNGVIPGWTEALQLMHVGDKWQLFIPSNLAYGKRSVGDKIKANSTLIFEIELLKINE